MFWLFFEGFSELPPLTHNMRVPSPKTGPSNQRYFPRSLAIFFGGAFLGGLLVYSMGFLGESTSTYEGLDAKLAGLPAAWLIFGFSAQAIFMSRMLVQWIASERARSSVVPVAFWWLSLIGGLMLLTYFVRRGDPVGVVGQLFGVLVYSRNLILLSRTNKPAGDT